LNCRSGKDSRVLLENVAPHGNTRLPELDHELRLPSQQPRNFNKFHFLFLPRQSRTAESISTSQHQTSQRLSMDLLAVYLSPRSTAAISTLLPRLFSPLESYSFRQSASHLGSRASFGRPARSWKGSRYSFTATGSNSPPSQPRPFPLPLQLCFLNVTFQWYLSSHSKPPTAPPQNRAARSRQFHRPAQAPVTLFPSTSNVCFDCIFLSRH
jgi:hypothetical protein